MNGWRELWEAAVLELRYQDAIGGHARPVDRAGWHYGMEMSEGYAAMAAEWSAESES